MVLEQLYSARWIEQKARYAFLMGLSYSVIGIGSAIMLFRNNPGLAAIAFTSLLILPSLNKLLLIEQVQASREEKFNIFLLFRDHWDIIKIYIFLFLGIMVAFSFFSLVWPAMTTSQVFSQQVGIIGGATGHAYYGVGLFKTLLVNNVLVLLFCLIASLIYGAGSIFIITWNASVWGTIFAVVAKQSAVVVGQNAFGVFIRTMIAVFPHMILEAGAYFLAVIAGGIVSKAVVRERLFSREFNQTIQDGMMMFILALIVLLIAVFVESFFAKSFIGWLGV